MKLTIFSLFIFLSVSLQAQWQTLNFQGSRVFLYLPKGYQAEDQLPLMVNLHGCAQKAEILKDHGNWEGAAEKFGVVVAIPEVPNGGVIAGCWDYYNMNHTRTNHHNGFVLGLVDKLLNDFRVDKDEVFVSGLSSGGGLSMVLACLAPDVFSGVGLNAGPSLGTSSGEISRARITEEEVISNCLNLAGAQRSLLRDQKVSLVYGNNDFLVDPNYNRLNARVFSEITDADQERSFDPSLYPGQNSAGQGTLFLRQGRSVVSIIENSGLGHNWPAGQGGSSRSFVNKNSINYPYYLLQFLTQ